MKKRKGKQRKDETGWDPHPWSGDEGEERLLHPLTGGKYPEIEGKLWELLEESAVAALWQAG